MKLGEILIGRSMIKQSDLDEALNAQLVYGGHLGTCLIELGCIGERELGAVLAEAFGIAYAPPEAFTDIPRFVIGALSAKVAEKHGAVPLTLQNKVLEVAMVDPKNLTAIDELRFASGYRIDARISAEVRIYQALERYYDIPRRLRYVRLCDLLERDAPIIAPSPSVGRLEPAEPTAVLMGERSATATLERPTQTQTAAVPVETPLDALTELMCRVKDESMLAQVFLDHVAQELPRVVLFRVKGGLATVWSTRGMAVPECGEFAITSEPVFRLLAGQTEYVGPVPGGPAHTGFFKSLDIRPPRDMVLAPAYLNDRLVALLYGDGGPSGDIPVAETPYRRLTDKLALGIGLVDIKLRLRET